MSEPKRPNILLFITDQQRADHTGFGGNPIVRTPNLDALARRSRVFDKAYVANPICMPNRCSILTGRVPTAHGVIFNDRSLAWSTNTFVRSLADAGYRTGLVGKAHFQYGTSRDSVRPLKKSPVLADPYPKGWDGFENNERYFDLEQADPLTDFYGFNHVEFALGHGDWVGGHHYHWALERGARHDELVVDYPVPDGPAKQRSPDWWQVYQPTLPEELYSTTFVTERSIDFLQAHGDTPWFLQASFPDPHHPFTPPGKWWDAYAADDMPLPATFGDRLDGRPEHLKLFQSMDPGDWFTQMFGPSETVLKQAMAAEFGAIEMIDEGIGKVLAALEASGAADNTLVLFTSDHGDMFGDHGLMLKAMMHYQGALRVPLTIAGPGIEPGRSDSLASSLDLAQTLLELTGLDEFDRMQGVSLKPILDDPAASVRDHVYVEEDMPITERGPIPHRARTVFTRDGRITRFSTGETEVYRFDDDPDELDNRMTSDPDGAFSRAMQDRLTQALMDYSDLARVNPD
jgi:arylsulfatase A-like enzyme